MVRVLAEVEKIWICCDVDNNGRLEFEEIKDYLKQVLGEQLNMSEEDLRKTFDQIDTNNDGEITKEEMEIFIKSLISRHSSLNFNL